MKNLIFKKINRNIAIPLYFQISEILEEMINKNIFKSNERFVSEEYLASQFGVSRPTISKAILILVNKSLLIREKGKMTLVRDNKVKLALMQELVSLYESLKRYNIPFKTIVLKVRLEKSSKFLAQKLGIKLGEKILYLERLRYIKNEPFLPSESYLPSYLFPDLKNENLSKNSLYELFDKKYHMPVIKTERCAKAIKASGKEVNLFMISLGDPLIQLDGVAFSNRNIKVEYFNTKIRGDKAALCTTLFRKKANVKGGNNKKY